MASCCRMDKQPVIHSLTRDEMNDLKAARDLLENPGFTMRLANYLGAPVEKGFALLPKGWNEIVNKAARGALMGALKLAISSLGKRNRRGSREFLHKVLAGTSGGI